MKIILSKAGQFWKLITTDRESGTIERLLVPSKVLHFLRHLLYGKE